MWVGVQTSGEQDVSYTRTIQYNQKLIHWFTTHYRLTRINKSVIWRRNFSFDDYQLISELYLNEYYEIMIPTSDLDNESSELQEIFDKVCNLRILHKH